MCFEDSLFYFVHACLSLNSLDALHIILRFCIESVILATFLDDSVKN